MRNRALLVGALALVALVAFASPASAHATLQESTPTSGAQVTSSPRAIVLRFSERVEVALGGVRVFDRGGERVDRGQIRHPGGQGSVVELALPELRDGAYVVTWRVVSADSHPVQGAFTFAVGDAEPASADDVAGIFEGGGSSRTVGVLYAISRTAAFATLLLLLGGVAFVVLVWPDGARDRRVRRVVVLALAVFAASSVANLALQGAYAAGLGLGDAFTTDVISGVLKTRFGRVYELRFALLVIAAALVAVFARRTVLPSWWRWAVLAVGVALAATPGLAGHAAVGSHEPLALVADVVHVCAAAVWFGGAVTLLVVLGRIGAQASTVAQRFSNLALYAVVVLVLTGLFQSYRQIGTVDALRSTEFGKFVIAKVALVAAVLLVAFVSRRTVQRWNDGSVHALRRSVAIETVIAVSVLSVTALLVNAVPSKVYAAAPQSGELASATLLVDFTVSPGRSGPNDIHLYTLTTAGQVRDVEEMSMSVSLEARGLSGIEVPLVKAAPGHFQALAFEFPFAGRWNMVVTARTTEIDSEVFEGSVQIK